MLYFDNAATTFPKPAGVLKAAQKGIVYYGGNPGRAGHDMSMRLSEKIFNVRKKAAGFFNTEAENVIFTSNCTMSLNTAIKGAVHSGSHIICSSLEHNSVIRPIHKLSQSSEITYDIASAGACDDDVIENFKSLIKPNTEVIVCTHASNVTGRVMPIERLGLLCKEHGITFIVDAAQSGGVIPIDIKKYNISALCLPGHKGLFGITGTGLLMLDGKIKLDTLTEGGTGSASADLNQPDFYPDRLESGTINTVGILTIGAGLDFIKNYGAKKLYEYEHRLCSRVYSELSKSSRIKLYEAFAENKITAPIVAFNIDGVDSNHVSAALNAENIAVRGGYQCAPLAHEFYGTSDGGMVRFSPSVFTKECEIELFVKKIKSIALNI